MQASVRFFVIVAAGLLPAALFASGLLTGSASAEAAPAANAPANNPSLRALVDGIERGGDPKQQPTIVLSEMEVSIDQHGTMAEVQMEARLTNPSDDEIEARFTLQLPRAAVLTGYSLDIGGTMIPGSLIDQPKAQQVYEDEVRGTIDPGLAEITSTNEFSTRVYPIAPEGSRRIALTFVTPVDAAAGLTIPLQTAGPVGVFRLNASVSGVREAPVISLTGNPDIEMERSGRAWSAGEYVLSEVQLSGELQISSTVARSAAMATRHSNGRTFFAITDRLTGTDLTQSPPERVRVYWDVSRSRADALTVAERSLLGGFLERVNPAAIDVVSFASAQPQLTRLGSGDAAALDAYLAGLTYRGATSFAGLSDVIGGNSNEEADLCLLFSDGGTSLNRSVNFEADCPLVVIASGPNVDTQSISRIADDNGGMALFLTAQNSAEILAQMQRMPAGVVSIRDAGGNRLQYAGLPAANGQFSVVGELGDWDEVTLRLSGTKLSERRRTYTIDTQQIGENDAAGALWAAQNVARLSNDPKDRDRMQQMAREFQVASPTMAFLVLESPDQYIAADIDPPRGFDQQWMTTYSAAKAQRENARKTEREDRLEFVITQWEETRQWWNSQFDPEAVMRRKNGQGQGQGQGQAQNGQRTGAVRAEAEVDAAADAAGESIERLSPPPPPPPPAPPALAVAPSPQESADLPAVSDGGYVGGGSEDTIVVTATRRASNLQETPIAVSAISAEDLSLTSSNGPSGAVVQVALAEVLSDRPYLEALDQAAPGERLSVLAEQEEAYGSVPGFYFDVAEWFRLKGETELARQLLLSALDLKASDDETLLIAAFRLERDGDYETAIELLEEMNARIEYRSQPSRILALALMARADSTSGSASLADRQRAFELLSEVVLAPTDGRYDGIETVALMELNSLIPLIEAAGGSWSLDERLIGSFATDLRVVVEWTSADADLDLWVKEPSGEEAYYGNRRTALGGKMSDDMTDGYGPEEYVLRNAYQGDYQVRVQGFSGDRINPNGPGRAMVRLIRNFARGGQTQQLIDAEVGFDRSNQNENDRVVATLSVQE